MTRYFWVLILLMMGACVPKEQVEFRKVLNVRFETVDKVPMLKADIVFYNPNKKGAKLKRIDLDILVNDKKGGAVDQTLNQKIRGQSEFTVPVEVKINMKEIGLMDTLLNLFVGKKYTVRMVGKIRVSVNGFAVTVPLDHSEELRLRL